LEELWLITCSPSRDAFETLDRAFLMSRMFPSKNAGGGPRIPWFRSFERSFSGLNIRASHIRMTMLTRPIRATATVTLGSSSSSSSMFCSPLSSQLQPCKNFSPWCKLTCTFSCLGLLTYQAIYSRL
jgi:hypothetical protein